MSFGALLQRIQRGLSTVELVHTPHPRWPLPPGPFTSPILQVSVLDSSFNPPTLAHLALANTLPPPTSSHDFDARLLLLSVRNADKQLKPRDATYEQRMEMMVLLAQELAHSRARDVQSVQDTSSYSATHEPNVAVAIIDEPTFVGKSSVLLDFFRRRISEIQQPLGFAVHSSSSLSPSPKLTFLMGTDTIIRFFAPRYYADEHAMAIALRCFLSPDENDSRIICARRTGKALPQMGEDLAELHLPESIKQIPPSNTISFVDIGEEERTFSSSEVREKLASQEESWRPMVPLIIANYIAEHGLYSFPS